MKKLMIIILSVVVVLVACYFSLGFFVIQPIGAVPEGATVLYFRLGMRTPFIASADGILKEEGASVSIMGRGLVLGAMVTTLKGRKIVVLPYSKPFYLVSTGGIEYEQ
jgi:hypothetical protein